MSKCGVCITRKSNVSYCTLFWPKYWAAAPAGSPNSAHSASASQVVGRTSTRVQNVMVASNSAGCTSGASPCIPRERRRFRPSYAGKVKALSCMYVQHRRKGRTTAAAHVGRRGLVQTRGVSYQPEVSHGVVRHDGERMM